MCWYIFYYKEEFNSLSSVKTTFRSQPPNHNLVFGFTSTLREAPRISYGPSPLASCSTLNTICAMVTSLFLRSVGNQKIWVQALYIHTYLICLRHLLHDQSLPQLPLRESDPSKIDLSREQFSAPPELQLEYSAIYFKLRYLRWDFNLHTSSSLLCHIAFDYTKAKLYKWILILLLRIPSNTVLLRISLQSPGQFCRIMLAHNIFSCILFENIKYLS